MFLRWGARHRRLHQRKRAPDESERDLGSVWRGRDRAGRRLLGSGVLPAKRISPGDEGVLGVHGRRGLLLHDHVLERQSNRGRLEDPLSPAGSALYSCGQRRRPRPAGARQQHRVRSIAHSLSECARSRAGPGSSRRSVRMFRSHRLRLRTQRIGSGTGRIASARATEPRSDATGGTAPVAPTLNNHMNQGHAVTQVLVRPAEPLVQRLLHDGRWKLTRLVDLVVQRDRLNHVGEACILRDEPAFSRTAIAFRLLDSSRSSGSSLISRAAAGERASGRCRLPAAVQVRTTTAVASIESRDGRDLFYVEMAIGTGALWRLPLGGGSPVKGPTASCSVTSMRWTPAIYFFRRDLACRWRTGGRERRGFSSRHSPLRRTIAHRA